MRTRDDVEAYLSRSNYPHREIEEATWVVQDPSLSAGQENLVVRISGDLCHFRLKVLDAASIPNAKQQAFYSALLELNATDMVHGAYGIADGRVLLTATLRLENLDFNEFIGTLDDFSVSLAKHHERLADLRTA